MRDGESFYITPVKSKESPLDIKGVNLGFSATDIVSIVNEGRERNYDLSGLDNHAAE